MSKNKKIAVIIILVILFAGVIWLVYNNFIAKQKTPKQTELTNQDKELSLPIVKKFNEEIFDSQIFTELEKHGEWDFTKQISVKPMDVNVPTSLENIKIIDPKIGRKLFIFWGLPEEINFNQILIYRSEAEDQNQRGELIAQLTNNEVFYEDNSVEDNKTYYYLILSAKPAETVEANNNIENQLIITVQIGNGEEKKLITSENSKKFACIATDSFPPAAPKNVEIKNKGDGKSIEIFWENPDDSDFNHVNIYQSTRRGELGKLLTINKADIQKQEGGRGEVRYSYTVSSVYPNITYYYTLTSVDSSENESVKKIINAQGNNNPFQPIVFSES